MYMILSAYMTELLSRICKKKIRLKFTDGMYDCITCFISLNAARFYGRRRGISIVCKDVKNVVLIFAGTLDIIMADLKSIYLLFICCSTTFILFTHT